MSEHDSTKTRDIDVKPNGLGYIVQLGSKTEKLTPYEAEQLFESLLKTLPGIVDGVELAWRQRNEPIIQVRAFYGVSENNEIVLNRYIAEAMLHGKAIARQPVHSSYEAAVTAMRKSFGRALRAEPAQVFEASRKIAEQQRTMKLAAEYCKSRGITMDELWKLVNQEKQG